jgi:antitoxin ParD1/3/4
MPTQNVNLSERQAKFIRESVNAGGYCNASEVVREALRLLEEQKRQNKLKLKKLREMIKQSSDQFQRGDFVVVGPGEIDHFMDGICSSTELRTASTFKSGASSTTRWI